MSGTREVVVGERGRIVIPAALRASQQWTEGTSLVAIDTSNGVLLASRDQVEQVVRAQLAGRDVVAELIEERRRAARTDDVA